MKSRSIQMIKVIGGGLAGCEAAWQLANRGIDVKLYEMKPQKFTPAHKNKNLAELVCSNSLKAARLDSAAGLLKAEMELLGSLTVPCAKECAVAAGGALAVDREKFSALVTEKIKNHPKIELVSEEVDDIPETPVIIATGPLTSDALADKIKSLCGGNLSFYDAAAPIVSFDSLDKEKVFFASRYDKGDSDYINCPMNKEEYLSFYNALCEAETAELKDFETADGYKVYEGCMPIERLAKRGEDTMRFGPLKPVGLIDQRTGRRPYAVVQLRREDAVGTMFNLVGFQTNLKFGEQKRVFSMIPGLENAEFFRYGVMHRNSFIDSPRLLNVDFSMKKNPHIYFAGQITGVEGYMESAASGIVAGINCARVFDGKSAIDIPEVCMIGALSRYISNGSVTDFQPMGANMGVLPPLSENIRDKKLKYMKLAQRSVDALKLAIDAQDI